MKSTAAQKRRLSILPKADKLWLLAGTAIITGAVMWPTHPALAACTPTGNVLDCVGSDAVTPQDFTPTDDFTVNIGSETPSDVDGSISVPLGDVSGEPALDIQGSITPFDGTINVYDGSFIEQFGAAPTATGLNVSGVEDIDLTVFGSDGTDAAGYIKGTGDAFAITDFDDLFVVNEGTILSTGNGDGIIGSNGSDVWIDNSSPTTIAGLDGIDFSDIDSYTLYNSGGVVAGYDGDGIRLEDIRDYNSETGDAVTIFNGGGVYGSGADAEVRGGGVIAGTNDGISINDVWYDDVFINNSGYYVEGEDALGSELLTNDYAFRSGGLIFGEDNNGIDIRGFDDDVYIFNNNTNISTSVSAGAGAESLSPFDLPDNGDFAAGIWGDEIGINIDGNDDDDATVDGEYVQIENYNGSIVGVETAGIRISNLTGDGEDAADINNGNGGLIWGGESGIDGENLEGWVEIDNGGYPSGYVPTEYFGPVVGGGEDGTGYAGGFIFGAENGIELDNVEDSVGIYNSLGEIWGGQGIGIEITNDGSFSSEDTNVGIFNGDYGEDGISRGGLIYGGESAIVIDEAKRATIYNGQGGFILGEGDQDAETPVIFLNLSSEDNLGEDWVNLPGEDEYVSWAEAAGEIVNFGIMSSHNLAHLEIDASDLNPTELPDWSFDEDAFRSDFADLRSYVVHGGSKGLLDGFNEGDGNNDYSAAASSLLVAAIDLEGGLEDDPAGAVDVYNYDTMFGRMVLQGANEDNSNNGNDVGNLIHNEGTWVVTDGEGVEDITAIESYGQDVIVNNGLIQAAVGSDTSDTTTFDVDEFANGSSYLKYEEIYQLNEDYEPVVFSKTGILSMVDGAQNDQVNVEGNYRGTYFFGDDYQENGYRSYVAMDVVLQDEIAYGNDNAGRPSDHLNISGFADGTTGIIFRKVDQEITDRGPVVGSRINVVSMGQDYGETCDGDFCKEGNTFFIASNSDDYFESTDGTGFIADGLYSWGLEGVEDAGEDYYDLVGFGGGPGAFNAPKIATGYLEIADEVFDVVHEHNSGGQFGAAGGGGADLPVDAPVYDAPAASGGTQTGLWAKVTGSQTERNSTVTENGFTFDTDSDQQIYTVLGGADMKWSPDSPFRMGIFGGYINSNMDFDLGDGSVDYEGGTVGTYLAYNNGAFYADTTVKGEFLTADYSFGDTEVGADGTNIGVSANTGYRFSGGNAYVEPLASVRYVHSSVDDFEDGVGSVEFSDPESLKAGVGARVGTVFVTGAATTELALLGRVWNEFEGENEVTVSDGVNPDATYSDDISGTYGEVEATMTITSGTLSGYVSASGQFGDDFTKYGAKAGVRKGF